MRQAYIKKNERAKTAFFDPPRHSLSLVKIYIHWAPLSSPVSVIILKKPIGKF